MFWKWWPREGTKLLWANVLVNCVFGGMAHYFHNTILNVMEDCLLDYLKNALYKTHGITMDEDTLSYVYSLFVVSIWSLGAVFGAAIAHSVVERTNRRNAVMVVLNIVTLFGAFQILLAMWTDVPGKHVTRCKLNFRYFVLSFSGTPLYSLEYSPLTTKKFVFRI